MNDAGPVPPDDGELTAFLDGQLTPEDWRRIADWIARDEAVRQRLEGLQQGGRPFKAAFDTMLDEPIPPQLLASLSVVKAPTRSSPWRGLRIAASWAVLALGGAALGQAAAPYVNLFGHPAPAPVASINNWREAVAIYFSLETPQTVAAIPDDAQARGAEIGVIAKRMKASFSSDAVNLPGLQLKRADIYQFKGLPLGEFLYSGSGDEPMAFCVIANGNPDQPISVETRRGLNIAFWQSQGRGFLVIGREPQASLRERATLLRDRFNS